MIELNKIYKGNCIEIIKTFHDKSIDCVITSPPYWQLRDYKWDGQWGLEPTFQMYLDNLWSLMDEVYRVLKNTGTAWINLGDTYGTVSGSMGAAKKYKSKESDYSESSFDFKQVKSISKCLLLIPHRFAIGCIDRGWIMRNDIIWAKRNGMPESVTDRFTKKHEYFFFMVKSEKYYFDLDGIRDKHSASTVKRFERGYEGNEDRDYISGPQNHMRNYMNNPEAKEAALERGKNPGSISDFWDIPTKGNSDEHYASYNTKLIDKPIMAGCPKGGIILDPFCGTATTGCRAIDLQRKFIGIEGKEEYVKIGNRKLLPFKITQQLF